MPKFLIVRFSSIGDIVLTSPVIRCLGTQIPNAEIHYLTKESFGEIVRNDPHISKVYTIQKSVREILATLKNEKYDHIIDLHHNVRSWQVIRHLGVSATSFPKLNIEKWMLVNLGINKLPALHIVDRYFKTVEGLGVENDQEGLDFHLPSSVDQLLQKQNIFLPKNFIALVTGAKFNTKQLPVEHWNTIVQSTVLPMVLLGGKEDRSRADEIMKGAPAHVQDLVGKTDLSTSAAILSKASKVVTHDTGLMHIAAAFKKEIISIWGNTTPEFGMYPYQTGFGKNGEGKIFEVYGLRCRPCSKLGHDECPKGHFKCMHNQDIKSLVAAVNS